jgi:hypothetical protein
MTYSLGLLPDDPTQERILLEVIDNPNCTGEQVMFCIDAATVTPGTDVRCDGSGWFYQHCAMDMFGRFPGEWPGVVYRGATFRTDERNEQIKSEKANGTYRPTLRELLGVEKRQATRRSRNAEWMRKRRAESKQHQQPASCNHCGATFTPKRSTARFCSTACRVASHRAQSADSADAGESC